MAIYRPCYATREEVRRTLDVQQATRNDSQIDRAIQSSAGAVDRLCMRRFYTEYKTYNWDWPNFQFTYPWKLYLDERELAGQPSSILSGPFLSTPVTIPVADVIFQPQIGPPYTWIELRRDLTVAFGNNTTPQYDIQITGPFGYWLQTSPAGTLAANITTTGQTTVQISDANLVDVGDTLIIGSEQMIVTNSTYISTGISFSAGCTTAQMNDSTMTIPDGTQFDSGEIILVDSEWMLILAIIGNNLIVKRGYSGSTLSTHNTGTTIWAKRLLTVTRGALGTTAATYTTGAALSIRTIPDLVKELGVAYAVVTLIQGPAGYSYASTRTWQGSQQRGDGQQQENTPGVGVPDLEVRTYNQYARKARSRVILCPSVTTLCCTGL